MFKLECNSYFCVRESVVGSDVMVNAAWRCLPFGSTIAKCAAIKCLSPSRSVLDSISTSIADVTGLPRR